MHETCQQDMQPTQPTAELVLGIKVRGLKLAKCFTSKMEDKRYIPPFPVRYVQGEFYIHLLLIKWVVSTLIRGYIKVRNLCVSLDVRMTFHSAASSMYQVLVLFITLIYTNQ